jgi:hypothetical protein
MSPATQTIVVALFVIGALAYLGMRGWHSIREARARKAGCGVNCGCE